MLYEVTYNAKQRQAIEYLSPDSPVEQVLYGGAASGGKTFLGCDWQIKRRLKYPNTRGLIGRAELKKLQLSTMLRFWEICSRIGLQPGRDYTYNGALHLIRFSNGSEIILMDMDDMPSDPEFQRFGSLEITDYFVDEAAEVSKKAMDILDSRVRYNLIGNRPKGLISCNPAKGWLYNDFYTPWKNDELPQHRAYVQALPTDNPETDPVYIQKLERLPDYDRERLLNGNWEYDDDEGKMFDTAELNRAFRDEVLAGTKFITADIARFGKDRTVICLWNGKSLIEVVEMHRAAVNEVAHRIKQMQVTHTVDLKNVIADEDGIGGGVVDILKCRGFNNGSKAKDDAYQNLKAQCYYLLANEINSNRITFPGCMHLKDEIIRQFEQIKRHRPNADGKLNVTPKEEIKRRYGSSPDHADAIMMRMYFELFPNLGKYVIM